jgi:hypothetical protein
LLSHQMAAESQSVRTSGLSWRMLLVAVRGNRSGSHLGGSTEWLSRQTVDTWQTLLPMASCGCGRLLGRAQKELVRQPCCALKFPTAQRAKVSTKENRETMKPTNVVEYVATLEDWRADVVNQLRGLILEAVPEAQERFKWSQPVYEVSGLGPFCYVKAFKQHINFGFWWGAKLSDPHGLLQGSGDKMRHVKISAASDVQPVPFKALAQESIAANREFGDPSKTKVS